MSEKNAWLQAVLLSLGDLLACGPLQALDCQPDALFCDGFEGDRGAITGTKWSDSNGDGSRNAAEPGLAGVTIYLDLNRNGQLDAEPWTTSDDNGHYWFAGLEPGLYRVREIIPGGFVQTFPTISYYEVMVEAGSITSGLDFGNQPEPGSVSGRKWDDRNNNGTRDEGEPGLAGVTIYLDSNQNGQLDGGEPSTVTDVEGQYELPSLPPGVQQIREVVPAGYEQTYPPNALHNVEISAGGIIEGLDFGNYRPPASLAGTKWDDINGNSGRDSGEPGLEGVTIYLDLNNNGMLDPAEPSDLTGADGRFVIGDLFPGAYRVREVLPGGYQQTFPATGFHEVVVSGSIVIDGLDFGNQRVTGSITGRKFEDLNGDGSQGDDEPGLDGITIYLDLNQNGVLDNDEPSDKTKAEGDYLLDSLLPGKYQVREIVPEGFEQTSPNLGYHEVDLQAGETLDGVDFGNRMQPAASP